MHSDFFYTPCKRNRNANTLSHRDHNQGAPKLYNLVTIQVCFLKFRVLTAKQKHSQTNEPKS